ALLPGVGHQDPRGQRAQPVVVVAVASAGLGADREALGQALEGAQHLFDASHLRALDKPSRLAKHAEGDALAVDVEPDVEHRYLPKSEYVTPYSPWFHGTRLTEASYLVSHLAASSLSAR